MGCNVGRVLVPADLRGADNPPQRNTAAQVSAGSSTKRSLQTTKEVDINQIIRGNTSLQCPSTCNIVRIFTSSTFTDTRYERDYLMKCVYPKLKAFCQSKGYEFHVVDMRWGVMDEATDDHVTAELCLKEVDLCKKLSTGPFFVTFLSHKYGYRNIPREIEASEFSRLLDGIRDEEVKRLLLRWFKKDNNALPPTYVLQPISSQIPEFLANDEEKKRAGKSKWTEEYGKMQRALIESSKSQLDVTRANRYAMSMTEAEIDRAVISSPENVSRSLLFYRKIKNIEDQEQTHLLSRYTDCVGSKENVKDVKERLTNLREKQLLKLLPRDNIVRYTVNWSPTGIDPEAEEEHRLYVDRLCEDFYSKLSAMINVAVQDRDTTQDPLIVEIIQHTTFCQDKCRIIRGRTDTLKRISYYMKDVESDFPLIVSGDSGSGKTCLMAAAARDTWRVLGTRGNIVIRFLGTTRNSSSIIPLLTSSIHQIRRMYGVHTSSDMPLDPKDVFELFQDTLNVATKSRPLAVFFDSLDQLDTADDARQLTWLPTKLPPFVKMVVSTLKEARFEIFPRLQALFPASSQYINIPKLSEEEVIHILDATLSFHKRQLTPSQRKVVEQAFQTCPLPLFLKMAIDQACQWRSFTPSDVTLLHHTIGQSINALFDKIEKLHGKLFVSRALGYLTISKSGLTEGEVEDVLSCDDDVLNDLFTYWTPPIRRLPPLLVVRLKNELGNYLVDRGADGVTVFFWYHRLFDEAARARYCSDPRTALSLHAALADYYAGTWAEGRSKPYTDKKGTSGTADRHVGSQPVKFDSVYNVRKLNNLPLHRTAAGQLELVKDECFCNFDFILAKIKAVGVRQILDDMMEARAVFPGDSQIQTVCEVIQLSQKCLTHDPDQLPSHIIGRIRRTEGFRSLIAQCRNAQHGFLLPSVAVLNPTGGPLLHCLADHSAEVTGLDVMTHGKKIVTCSLDNSVKVWDVSTGRLLQSIDRVGERPTKVMMCYRNTIVCVQTARSLVAFEIVTRVQQRFKVDVIAEKASVCNAGENKTRLAIFSGTSLKLRSARTGKLLGQDECALLESGDQFSQSSVSVGCTSQVAVSMGNRVFLYHLLAMQFSEDILRIPDVDDVMKDIITCMTFCADDKRIVIGGGVSVTLYVIDIEEKTVLQSLPGVKHDRMASFVHVTSDNRFLITASWEKIVLWDLRTSSRYPVLRHPTRAVTNVATVDGNILASIASDAVVRLWDLSRDDASIHPGMERSTSSANNRKDGQVTTPIQEIDDDFNICEIYLTSNPRYVLLYGVVRREAMKIQFIRVYDLATSRPVRQIKLNSGKSSLQVVMVGDRQTLVVEWTGKVKLLDLVTSQYVGQLKENIPQNSTLPQDLTVITDDTEVLTLSEDRLNLKVFSLDTLTCTHTVEAGQKEKITGFVKNNANSTVVTSTLHGPYLVYDLTSRLFLYRIDSCTLNIKSFTDCKATDDDRYLVCREQTGNTSNLLVWELKTRRVHARMNRMTYEPDNKTTEEEISLRKFVVVDNRKVLASYSDNTLRYYDLRSGQLVREVESHGGVHWICLQPGSPYIVTYNNTIDDNVIRMWDKVSLRCLASYSPDFRPIVTTLSKDGQCILASFRQMSSPVVWRLYAVPRDTVQTIHWSKCPEIYISSEVETDLSEDTVKSTPQSPEIAEKNLSAIDPEVDVEKSSLVASESDTDIPVCDVNVDIDDDVANKISESPVGVSDDGDDFNDLVV